LDPGLWKQQIHPSDRDAVLSAWRRLHDGEAFDFDYRIIVPDRGERWVNARGKLVRGADGRPERIDGLARDMTEQFEHRARIARRTGRPARWNDLARDAEVPARDRPRFLASGIAAAASFPLVVDGKPIGLLGLHAREAGFFDQDEMRMLEELTANISFALELI